MKAYVFVQKLRRILRPSVVKESAHKHNPLLINSLAALNFHRRLMLEFPGESAGRYRAFSQ
jgi:hypothetical protein